MNEGRLVERRVTYTLEHNGQFYVVENVPARVDEETGEQLFAPATVERLQAVILEKKPDRVIETPCTSTAKKLRNAVAVGPLTWVIYNPGVPNML